MCGAPDMTDRLTKGRSQFVEGQIVLLVQNASAQDEGDRHSMTPTGKTHLKVKVLSLNLHDLVGLDV